MDSFQNEDELWPEEAAASGGIGDLNDPNVPLWSFSPIYGDREERELRDQTAFAASLEDDCWGQTLSLYQDRCMSYPHLPVSQIRR